MNDMQEARQLNDIIIGMEPIGHYWLSLAACLKDRNLEVVLVNPHLVKKNKENREWLERLLESMKYEVDKLAYFENCMDEIGGVAWNKQARERCFHIGQSRTSFGQDEPR
jgi:hypothetical protein